MSRKKNNNKKQLSLNESWLSQQIQPYCVYLKQHKDKVGGGGTKKFPYMVVRFSLKLMKQKSSHCNYL